MATWSGDSLEAPRGYLTPAKAVRIRNTDLGPVPVDAHGNELSWIKRPTVLPLYRDPEAGVRFAVPGMADVAGNMTGAPVGAVPVALARAAAASQSARMAPAASNLGFLAGDAPAVGRAISLRAEQPVLPPPSVIGESRAANGAGPWFSAGTHNAPPPVASPPWALGPGRALRAAVPLAGLAAAMPDQEAAPPAAAGSGSPMAPRIYLDGNPDITGQSGRGSPAAPVAAGPPMQLRREAPVPTPPVREVVAAPPPARASILDRIFSGESYQSADPRNERPNMASPLRRADNSINWGDSDLASDFFRADRAQRGYASGGGVSAEQSSALLKALDIIDRLTQRR